MHISDFLDFKWKYLPSLLFSRFATSRSRKGGILFVTLESTKDWILGAKAIRLSRYFPSESNVYYSRRLYFLPDREGYFFLHQKYFARALKYNSRILKRKNIVMFTHPEWNKKYSAKHMAYVLNFADKIICLNNAIALELISLGVKSDKIHIFHMASDTEMFTPKIRDGKGAIGFCMAYYKRKNPELIIELVKRMPDKEFILIGINWEKYERFDELVSYSNFKYYANIQYEKYPELYHKMDVFVSPSHLEGGPVPLLEAMLCNIVPVASNTGFSPQLIENGKNGFLFNSTDPVNNVIELIRKAYDIKISVREAAEPHSWKNYGLKIGELFKEIKKFNIN